MRRILILTSHDNNLRLNESNMGVTALIITAIESIKKYVPDAIFFTPGQFSEAFCSQYNLNVIKGRIFTYKVLSVSETIKSFLLLVRSSIWFILNKYLNITANWLVANYLLKEIIQADLIIVFIHDTFSDNSRMLSIVDHIIEISTAYLLNKHVMIWNSSIGPLNNYLRLKLGRFLLNRAKIITLREKKSLAYLQEAGIEKQKLYLFPDTVFLLEPATRLRIEEILSKEKINQENRPFIAVCIGREFPLGEQKKDTLQLKIVRNMYRLFEYCLPDTLSCRIASFAGRIRSSSEQTHAKRKALAEVVDYLAEHLNATVLLISHIILPRTKNYIDMRDERLEALSVFYMVKKKEHVKVIRGVYTTDEIKGIVGKCDLLIGMRMHICVASVSQFVPTLAITYNYKFLGMMEFAGQEQWICEAISAEEIISKVERIWMNRDAIRNELMERMPQVKTDAYKHAELAVGLLAGN